MKYKTYNEVLQAVKQYVVLDSKMHLYNTLFVSKQFSLISICYDSNYYIDILQHNVSFYNTLKEQSSNISLLYKLLLVDNIYSDDIEYEVIDNILVHKPTRSIVFAAKDFSFDNCCNLTVKQYSMINARKDLAVKNVKLEKQSFDSSVLLNSIVIENTDIINSTSLFHGCENLSYVEFKQSCKCQKIMPDCFGGCINLQCLKIKSDSIVSIEEDAFNKCNKLESIILDIDKVIHLNLSTLDVINCKIYVRETLYKKYVAVLRFFNKQLLSHISKITQMYE